MVGQALVLELTGLHRSVHVFAATPSRSVGTTVSIGTAHGGGDGGVEAAARGGLGPPVLAPVACSHGSVEGEIGRWLDQLVPVPSAHGCAKAVLIDVVGTCTAAASWPTASCEATLRARHGEERCLEVPPMGFQHLPCDLHIGILGEALQEGAELLILIHRHTRCATRGAPYRLTWNAAGRGAVRHGTMNGGRRRERWGNRGGVASSLRL